MFGGSTFDRPAAPVSRLRLAPYLQLVMACFAAACLLLGVAPGRAQTPTPIAQLASAEPFPAAQDAEDPITVDNLQKALKRRWEGAWVVVDGDLVSNCDGAYTNNTVRGQLFSGDGAVTFPAGELGRVHKVDVNRSRIDVLIDLTESLLVPRQDGPFALYEEVSCQVELEVDVPRHVVKDDRLDLAQEALDGVLVGFRTLEEARESTAWNGRERASYPDDYEQTLAEHRVWRAEEQNRLMKARIDEAVDRAANYLGYLVSDPNAGQYFARGARSVAGRLPSECSRLLRASVQRLPVPGGLGIRAREAYVAGQRLTFYVELAKKLRSCVVDSL